MEIWELFGIIWLGFFSIFLLFNNINLNLPSKGIVAGRDSRTDFLRGLAMTGIVCIHIHSYFIFFHAEDSTVTTYTLFLSNLARFSVPVFILSSGLLLKDSSSYWLSKLKQTLLPYLVVSLLGYFIKYSHWSLWELIPFLLLGKVFAPFYFIPLLFQFYLLFYVFFRSTFLDKYLKPILSLSFILNLLSNLGYFAFLPNWYESISIFNYIFFFVLGIVLNRKPIATYKNKLNWKLSLSVSLFGFIVVLTSITLEQIDLKNHHVAYPIVFITFIWNFYENIPNFLKQIFEKIGNMSMFIFLLHPLVIHWMHSFDPYSLLGPFIAYLITLFLNISLPMVYGFTYQKGKSLNR